MSRFTTRVELHDANWNDYEKLHEKMRGEGFSQTIAGSDGVIHELPPAEYNFDGAVDRSAVLGRARRAAGAVKSSFSVLVTESAGREWFNLSAA